MLIIKYICIHRLLVNNFNCLDAIIPKSTKQWYCCFSWYVGIRCSFQNRIILIKLTLHLILYFNNWIRLMQIAFNACCCTCFSNHWLGYNWILIRLDYICSYKLVPLVFMGPWAEGLAWMLEGFGSIIYLDVCPVVKVLWKFSCNGCWWEHCSRCKWL